MTQSSGGSDGYAPRLYEAEVYAKVAGAEAKKIVWERRDPSEVAGKYSNKAAEVYQRIVGAEGGSYRAGLEAPDLDYRGMPHEKLIAMVHDGVSPEDVDEQGMIVNDMGNAQKQLASDFRQAVAKEEASWRGPGADAAHTFVKQLADWADSSGDAAFLSANRYSQTSAALANARNSMPEPAGRTVTQSLELARQQFSSGNFGDGMDTLQNIQSQAMVQFQTQQQAAEVLAQRDEMLYSGGSTQPIYAPPPQLSRSTASVPTQAGSPTSGPTIPQAGHTVAVSAVPPPPVSAGPVSRTTNVGTPPSPSSPVPGGDSTASNAAGGFPEGDGNLGGWSRPPTSALGPGQAEGFLPIAGNPASGDSGIEGGGSRRTGGMGDSFGRSGGGAGSRLTGSGGAGEEDGLGAGKRTGGQPGARAAVESVRTGATGSSGKNGAAGTGLGGVGGGKKSDEDKEHKRAAYVVETDTDTAFGLKVETDQDGNKIAPPVIGE